MQSAPRRIDPAHRLEYPGFPRRRGAGLRATTNSDNLRTLATSGTRGQLRGDGLASSIKRRRTPPIDRASLASLQARDTLDQADILRPAAATELLHKSLPSPAASCCATTLRLEQLYAVHHACCEPVRLVALRTRRIQR
jgi:hypothetical protein